MNAADTLTKFATDNNISMSTIKAITDNDKIVDLLYKLTPDQWTSLTNLFPQAQQVITENAQQIEKMNSFLGVNLAVAPWQGFEPNLAWIIPILAGLSQWYSSKHAFNVCIFLFYFCIWYWYLLGCQQCIYDHSAVDCKCPFKQY